jgi:hypothetical protein
MIIKTLITTVGIIVVLLIAILSAWFISLWFHARGGKAELGYTHVRSAVAVHVASRRWLSFFR